MIVAVISFEPTKIVAQEGGEETPLDKRRRECSLPVAKQIDEIAGTELVDGIISFGSSIVDVPVEPNKRGIEDISMVEVSVGIVLRTSDKEYVEGILSQLKPISEAKYAWAIIPDEIEKTPVGKDIR